MTQEIERKFLVAGDFKSQAHKAVHIIQGYLSLNKDKTVRVRLRDDKAFLTVKGKPNESGMSRFEWEKEIPFAEAQDLIKLCGKNLIDKTRYLVQVGNHTYEVDEFHGANKGLYIAEVELKSEDEYFEKPDWLGTEVTGNKKYHNSYLIQNPFCDWEKEQ